MSVIGLDIGGANLKASDGVTSRSRPFALWKSPDKLATELQDLVKPFHQYGSIAATMTGELADCFETRASGVRNIVAALQAAFPQRQINVWQVGGEFLSPDDACQFPNLVAAANWHALATWMGRACPEQIGLMIDIGSTTTDVIKIENGFPAPTGTTDLARLQTGELVYCGVRRTPLFAITSSVLLQDQPTPLAAELFATTIDLEILLGDMAENPADCDTANGQPATRAGALRRVARAVCSDTDQLTEQEILTIANQCRAKQLDLLAHAVQSVLASCSTTPQTVMMSGEGEGLITSLLEKRLLQLQNVQRLSMNHMLGPEHSQAACAFALAKLGSERL